MSPYLPPLYQNLSIPFGFYREVVLLQDYTSKILPIKITGSTLCVILLHHQQMLRNPAVESYYTVYQTIPCVFEKKSGPSFMFSLRWFNSPYRGLRLHLSYSHVSKKPFQTHAVIIFLSPKAFMSYHNIDVHNLNRITAMDFVCTNKTS